MRYPKYNQRWLLMIATVMLSCSIQAQDSIGQVPAKKSWHFRVEPYMMFPNMSGNSGIALLPLVEVNANPSDIFDKLQMGAMLNFEATNGVWAINSDLLYMSLEQDISAGALVAGGQMNAKQLGWELAVFKRATPWLEFGIGGLLNSLNMELSIDRKQTGGTTVKQSGSKSKTWVDPMIITRLTTQNKGKFFGQFRAEVGGFGIGSDFAWQAQAMAGYRFSKLFDINVGYRGIGLDYVSGEGADAFIYDMITFGPMLRFGFSF